VLARSKAMPAVSRTASADIQYDDAIVRIRIHS
jgi:hypothetical protein